MFRIKRLVLLLCCIVSATSLYSMNLIRPYQIVLRPPKEPNSWLQLYSIGQFGFGDKAFDFDGEQVNPLQIYQCQQNALAMLNGFDPSTKIGQKRIRVDADDDCFRGQFVPCGSFDVDAALRFGMRFFMHHNLSLAFYLPFYKMSLTDVVWQDLTPNVSIEDARVHAYLTDCFVENVCELGDLDITGWKRSGVGDTTVSLEWINDFPQQKELLHNVTINGRLGMTLPSGLKTDEDKILAFSFGNDDAIGVVFALGLDLYLGEYIKAGFDVQLMHLFGNTRCRRIKTDVRQTDLLLLQKASAFKDYGLTQQFSLYWQFYKVLYGASFEVAYQFYKRGEDILSLTSNEFSTEIANSAINLQGFTTHDAFFILSYDFQEHMADCYGWSPYVAGFVNIPFNGKRSIVAQTAGFVFGFNF